MGSSPPCLSFIGIVDFSDEAKWIYMTPSVADLLGYEPKELIGRPSLELVHPDEFPRVKKLHYDTIKADQAAVLVYLRMKHKEPSMGYILCGISRTVVHNVLVGSVSFASPAKAMHNASTAQEVTVITPSASKFQFGRWHDPPPVNASVPCSPSSWNSRAPTPSTPSERASHSHAHSRTSSIELRRQDSFSFSHLPNQSLRTLFILDRFSSKCPILYCSNDLLVTTTEVLTRSFFDFVYEKDEEVVRNWINQVKSWGVNDLGQPSDGGFGYGWFTLLTRGRDSGIADRIPEPSLSSRSSKHRGGSRRGDNRDHASSRRDPHHHHHQQQNGRGPSSPILIRNGRGGMPPSLRLSPPSNGALPAMLPPPEGSSPLVQVDAIFSAHSDGLMVILRRSEQA